MNSTFAQKTSENIKKIQKKQERKLFTEFCSLEMTSYALNSEIDQQISILASAPNSQAKYRDSMIERI